MQAFQRGLFAAVFATAAAVAALPVFAQAQQKFPTKPVRLVVPSPVGGQPDLVARIIGPMPGEYAKVLPAQIDALSALVQSVAVRAK